MSCVVSKHESQSSSLVTDLGRIALRMGELRNPSCKHKSKLRKIHL